MGQGSSERRIAELIGDGRKWTEAEARYVLAAWEASGESGPAFGRRFGIVPQRLWWWRSRLSSTTSSFVPVEVTKAEAAIVVTIERGLRIEVAVADAGSAEWVAMLVERLRVEGT
jgi:hypothetical protein